MKIKVFPAIILNMSAPELDLSRFPKEPHGSLIRPANRLSDEVINEYAGIRGGRTELATELAEDIGCTLLEPWAVLSKDKERKSITFVYPSSPNEKSGLMEIIGTKIESNNLFENINLTEIHETVDPKNLDTESTGVTKDMILAAERANKMSWARLRDGKYRSARFQKELERKRESGEQQAYGKNVPGWDEIMKQIEEEDGESSKD